MTITISKNQINPNQVDSSRHVRVAAFIWLHDGQWVCRMKGEKTYWEEYEDAEAYALLMLPDDPPTLH